MNLESIARVAHEANRALALELLEEYQQPWHQTKQAIRDSALAGVEAIATGVIKSPEESHESWMKFKAEQGWIYGPSFSFNLKHHPCMLPLDQLSSEQKAKDILFFNIVSAMLTAYPNLDKRKVETTHNSVTQPTGASAPQPARIGGREA